MTIQKHYAHVFIILGLALMLVAIGQLGKDSVAWADGTQFQTVPTRTPTPRSNNNNDNDEAPTSSIVGQVVDLSTGQPGAGVIVRINDIDIRTDTNGKYSLSGLQAGTFEVSLSLTNGAVPNQDPITVTVDGRTETVVDLTYFSDSSQAPASVTATPQPEPAATNNPQPEPEATNTPQPEPEATNTPQPEPEATATAVEEDATTQERSTPADSSTTNTDADTEQNKPETLPVSGGINYGFWLLFVGGFLSILAGLKLKSAYK